ncbi:hypothetical protein [Ralstonia solanacearum]|uniref:hypothetical protein n=1 Tax=Ralstonia solanacearum TaxID=305 RepID=UPI0004503388|nr:hypothetical protein [Ralstonia solanacearum]EUJ14815.1 hypothetical protein RSP673_08760 [Ralstonia solanacearum P673]MCL9845039.1 hypothetical protein [Ralstonia solanacearum]MCL9851537.1 hypothetical protein [Ralstonia solanacearum]MCL9855552.1 hypothetical protein [Ralstonia solanacearum]MCL9858698.1 hypothetical protein [Ralstonia solanacearum]
MQNENIATQGDTGQAVAAAAMRDRTVAASQRGNAIAVNSGTGDPAAEPIRRICDLQRGRIAAKVRELTDASGLKELEVYRIILADFGLTAIGDLRRDQFKTAMEKLGRWISEARDEPATEAAHASAARNAPCAHCAERERQLVRARRRATIAVCGALMAGALAAYSVLAPRLTAAKATIHTTAIDHR